MFGVTPGAIAWPPTGFFAPASSAVSTSTRTGGGGEAAPADIGCRPRLVPGRPAEAAPVAAAVSSGSPSDKSDTSSSESHSKFLEGTDGRPVGCSCGGRGVCMSMDLDKDAQKRYARIPLPWLAERGHLPRRRPRPAVLTPRRHPKSRARAPASPARRAHLRDLCAAPALWGAAGRPTRLFRRPGTDVLRQQARTPPSLPAPAHWHAARYVFLPLMQ
jgi:hypothetical protein